MTMVMRMRKTNFRSDSMQITKTAMGVKENADIEADLRLGKLR